MNASIGLVCGLCLFLLILVVLGISIATLVHVHRLENASATLVAPAPSLNSQSTLLALEDATTQSNFQYLSLFATDLTAFDAAQPKPAHGGPLRVARTMAIVNIAMADAVAASTRAFQPYTALPFVEPGVSVSDTAALATAARETLVVLYPNFKQLIDTTINRMMASVANTAGKQRGIALGKEAARLILTERLADGADHAEPAAAQFESQEPGKWRRDPVTQAGVALGGLWAQRVAPFVITAADQFRAPPPPALDTTEFAMEFQEVKAVGGDGANTVTVRDDWGTLVGLYWAYDGTGNVCAPPRLYIQLAFAVANQNNLNMLDTVRMIATLAVAMADTGLAAWESKYFYLRGRPVTVIRQDAGLDDNPQTEPDSGWTPMGAPASNSANPNFTPPFPSYPSGHATFGGAMAEVFRSFLRNDTFNVLFTSSEFDGKTKDNTGKVRPFIPRMFSSASQMEFENGDSRVKLGIHFRMDSTVGIEQGQQVAQFVIPRLFQPLSRAAKK